MYESNIDLDININIGINIDMYVDAHKDNQIDTNISFSVFSLVYLKQCLIPVFNIDNILLNIKALF